MLNIMCVCGLGVGSSFACQMSVEDVLRKMGVKANLNHCDISSASGAQADIFIAGKNFETQFDKFSITAPQIFLNRMVDKKEIKEKLEPVLKEMGVIE